MRGPSGEAAANEINNVASLRRWLEAHPHDYYYRVVAARVIFRILPLVLTNVLSPLVVFRIALTIEHAAKSPYGGPVMAVEATSLIQAKRNRRASSQLAIGAFSRIVRSGTAEALSVGVADAAEAATAAATEGVELARVVTNIRVTSSLWAQVAHDAQQLESGLEPLKLMASPLWARNVSDDGRLSSIPGDWARRPWAEFRRSASDRNGFDIWVRWYEGVLRGRPAFGLSTSMAQEVVSLIVEQHDEWWQRVPAEVNEDIRAWVEAAGRGSQLHATPIPTVAGFIIEFLDSLKQPATLPQIERAYRRARGMAASKTIRGELSKLSAEGLIVRVRRGLYRALGDREEGSPSLSQLPAPVEGVPSPFEYAVSADGRISVAGDALGALRVPAARGGRDAIDRLEAARQLATDLAEELATLSYQVRQSYRTHLQRYASRLPENVHGNIYLADAEARTLRDEIVADLADGCDERFARRLARLLEQHYGLRVYFPDLLSFYDDVRRGELSDPPPLAAFEALGTVINEYTPDVFNPDVGESVSEVQVVPAGVPAGEKAVSEQPVGEAIVLPPDPIADIDPVRAGQRARAGALNRIWAAMLKLEKGSNAIKRAESAVNAYGKYFKPVIDWLLGGPPPGS